MTAAAAGVYALVYLVWLLSAQGEGPLRGFISNAAVLPIDALAGWAAACAAWDPGRPAGLRLIRDRFGPAGGRR